MSIAPYYSVQYLDRMREAQHGKKGFFFIVYRRCDDQAVFESSTYNDEETSNRAAQDVTADFIEQGEQS
jgi:hypothetical protein